MKKNTIYKPYIFFILAILSCSGFSQTTNTGVLSVSEGTEFSTVEDFSNTSSGEFYNDGESFIYRGFRNDGVVDFYGSTGLTRFIGSSPQQISGARPSYFYNIYFDNASGQEPFHLSGEIEAFGLVDFYRGIIDIDNYGGLFTFGNGASHVNTSDVSHVDGPVQKDGSEGFTFPIGDGGYYRFSGISEAPSQGTYRSKYYLENSGELYGHDLRPDVVSLIDDREYWTIEPVASTDDVMVTLSWREATTPPAIISTPQEGNIHIVRWDAESNMWVDEGGAVDIDNRTVTTAVSDYGVFTLARVKSEDILPCDVVVYNAVTPNGDGINDFFRIDNTNSSCAKNLKVKIFNRWGVKVYETNNYGANGNVFDGHSEGRATVQGSSQLPTGTYFYILDYRFDSGDGEKSHKQAGYLYLNGN